jgi:bifunctional enzyme CysN/CysC
MDLLRFSTAGSVDDGKSTLIGRLLYDTKSIFEDQLAAVEEASERRGEGYVNLALLTDGLRAEREQNITIDVAYRYFATPRRRFIIADTPGHIQYTGNMVTGASTAELAIILIDARNGVLTQSKRHGFISSLLGIPHILVAINKMDLVDWSEEVYEDVVGDYSAFAEKLGVDDLTFIPISALLGDNVVDPSENMAWYRGSTLLHHLEHVNVGAHRNLVDFRFPVQYVIRPDQNYRAYAGRVASGVLRPGEEILILPSRKTTTVKSIDTFDGALDEAVAGDSVSIVTTDELDISRGDMIVRPMNLPMAGSEIDATICWTSDVPMEPGTQYFEHLREAPRQDLRLVCEHVDRDACRHRGLSDHRRADFVHNAEVADGVGAYEDRVACWYQCVCGRVHGVDDLHAGFGQRLGEVPSFVHGPTFEAQYGDAARRGLTDESCLDRGRRRDRSHRTACREDSARGMGHGFRSPLERGPECVCSARRRVPAVLQTVG